MEQNIPIITIVGNSNSGKTTLIEKLIPEFIRRGYRIGTVKHHLHDFDIDKKGKDTWRHAQAGADTVIISSPHKLAMVKKMTTETSLDTMRENFFSDVDLILAEGYKRGDYLKVEIFRAAVHEHPLFSHDEKLLATVTDSDIHTGKPCFRLEEIVPLVDLLENVLFPESARTMPK